MESELFRNCWHLHQTSLVRPGIDRGSPQIESRPAKLHVLSSYRLRCGWLGSELLIAGFSEGRLRTGMSIWATAAGW